MFARAGQGLTMECECCINACGLLLGRGEIVVGLSDAHIIRLKRRLLVRPRVHLNLFHVDGGEETGEPVAVGDGACQVRAQKICLRLALLGGRLGHGSDAL
ncbi:hypothetical protein BCR44DRAFT_1429620 [Catenaria anguillulae PL171]|uniref:Uncharacterized protein n=1 Tax=Catenaria anguillulae PL171 TaxID=765915 RepID=A0A1Y2HW08_9FUNG|nr:hypothetical protein BCR44DRAFT_1429620 [Catenaria anguillulae PL171]